jgi:hypothetical protein
MHWDIENLQKWVTLIAAIVAAIASGLNLWWKFRDKADKIKVACGLIDPQLNPGEFLTVVSQCDHSIQIADYGYVMRTGKLLSLPNLDARDLDDEPRIVYGSRLLASRNTSFETGIAMRGRPVGVYAITTSQTRPTVAFEHDTHVWLRAWLRMKIWLKVVYD